MSTLAIAVRLVTDDLTSQQGTQYTPDQAVSETWNTLTVNEVTSWQGQDLVDDKTLDAYLAVLTATAPELDDAVALLEG